MMVHLRRTSVRPHLVLVQGEAMALASTQQIAFFVSEGESKLAICRYHAGGWSHPPSAALKLEAEAVPLESFVCLLGRT